MNLADESPVVTRLKNANMQIFSVQSMPVYVNHPTINALDPRIRIDASAALIFLRYSSDMLALSPLCETMCAMMDMAVKNNCHKSVAIARAISSSRYLPRLPA